MFYASALKYVLGAQKNRLNETVFEYPQHIFWLRNKEHIFLVPTLNMLKVW